MSVKKQETEKKVAAPVYKVTLVVHGERSTIHRGGGLPMLIDRTEKSVEWLAAHEYKPEEINIEGDKPACWATVYPEPVVETPVIETPVVAETPASA